MQKYFCECKQQIIYLMCIFWWAHGLWLLKLYGVGANFGRARGSTWCWSSLWGTSLFWRRCSRWFRGSSNGMWYRWGDWRCWCLFLLWWWGWTGTTAVVCSFGSLVQFILLLWWRDMSVSRVTVWLVVSTVSLWWLPSWFLFFWFSNININNNNTYDINNLPYK